MVLVVLVCVCSVVSADAERGQADTRSVHVDAGLRRSAAQAHEQHTDDVQSGHRRQPVECRRRRPLATAASSPRRRRRHGRRRRRRRRRTGRATGRQLTAAAAAVTSRPCSERDGMKMSACNMHQSVNVDCNQFVCATVCVSVCLSVRLIALLHPIDLLCQRSFIRLGLLHSHTVKNIRISTE